MRATWSPHRGGRSTPSLSRFTDMQGRLQGKRLHARYFLDVVLEHGTEGCNYLLAVDVDMNTVDGYAMSLLGARLRRLRDVDPDLATLRPHALAARAPVMVRADLSWTDGSGPVAAVAPVSPARPDRRGWPTPAARPSPAPSWSSSSSEDTYEQAWTAGYRDLTAGQPYNVDYSMLGDRTGRAAAARHPQRDVRRRADRRVRQGRVQPGPARDRVPLRRRRPHLRQPRHLQERRQGDRRRRRACP